MKIPKANKPALTSAERVAMTRKRKKITFDECEKVGVVLGKSYPLDKQLLSAFERLAALCPSIRVEDLLFIAMRDFIASEEVYLEGAAKNGLEDVKSHQSKFNLAKLNIIKRLSEEGLDNSRVDRELVSGARQKTSSQIQKEGKTL